MLFQLVCGATPARSEPAKNQGAVPPGSSPRKLAPMAPIYAAWVKLGSSSNAVRSAGLVIVFTGVISSASRHYLSDSFGCKLLLWVEEDTPEYRWIQESRRGTKRSSRIWVAQAFTCTEYLCAETLHANEKLLSNGCEGCVCRSTPASHYAQVTC